MVVSEAWLGHSPGTPHLELIGETNEGRGIIQFELKIEPFDEVVHIQHFCLLESYGDVAETYGSHAGGLHIVILSYSY